MAVIWASASIPAGRHRSAARPRAPRTITRAAVRTTGTVALPNRIAARPDTTIAVPPRTTAARPRTTDVTMGRTTAILAPPNRATASRRPAIAALPATMVVLPRATAVVVRAAAMVEISSRISGTKVGAAIAARISIPSRISCWSVSSHSSSTNLMAVLLSAVAARIAAFAAAATS